MSYDNEMTFVLFRQKDKKTDKHPDFTGKLTIGGVTYSLAGWTKDGKTGKFLAGKVSDLREKSPMQSGPRSSVTSGSLEDLTDDIPF